MKRLFKKYPVGTVFNPISKNFENLKPNYRSVSIIFPSRLNAMAIDPSKIVTNENMVFTPGEIVFSVQIYKKVTITLHDNNQTIVISKDARRKPLIQHSAMIMQKALRVEDGIYIEVDNKDERPHYGFGSSSSLIAAVACGINELYGKPVNTQDLVKYLAQNHGEEISDREDSIQQVQCIGGSAASGMFQGSLLMIAGQSQIIKTMNVPHDYKAIIGVPQDFQPKDATVLMAEEEKNLSRFLQTGKRYGKEIAYRILHEVLPAMNGKDLIPIGNLIFDYRFKMGSIRNCSFVYPKITTLAKRLVYVKTDGLAEVLSLSSVGPAFFAITKKCGDCLEAFKNVGLASFVVNLENDTYKVISRGNSFNGL